MAYLVNLEEFLKLGINTVFCKYEPFVVDEMQIKGESLSNDFYVLDLDNLGSDNYIKYMEVLESGGNIEFDLHCQSRDACFKPEQQFLVFDNADVQRIINRLKECI